MAARCEQVCKARRRADPRSIQWAASNDGQGSFADLMAVLLWLAGLAEWPGLMVRSVSPVNFLSSKKIREHFDARLLKHGVEYTRLPVNLQPGWSEGDFVEGRWSWKRASLVVSFWPSNAGNKISPCSESSESSQERRREDRK